MSPRDPRLDPRIGDTVALGGMQFVVTGSRLDGRIVCAAGADGIFAEALITDVHVWRALFKEAEVVRAV